MESKSNKVTFDIKHKTDNYGTEIASNYLKNSLKWPLSKLSEKFIDKRDKLNCKTSMNLIECNKIKERSMKLLFLSEAYIESAHKSATDHDSEIDSDLSSTSLDYPENSDKAKMKFEELINRYYMCSSENIQGNYDAYVTNCLKLIGYFKKQSFFFNKNEFIKESIKLQYGKLKLSNKPLLILDLDETLIHSDLDMKWSAHDFYIKTEDDSVIPINIRPYLFEFLEFCNINFDIIIYTASCKDYADPVIDFIEKEKSYFKYRFYREHCISYGSFLLKDISIFEKPLNQTLIIDNNLFSFAHYLKNGILISSYYNESNDLDLVSLMEFFNQSIIGKEDIREEIERTFEFNKICKGLKK